MGWRPSPCVVVTEGRGASAPAQLGQPLRAGAVSPRCPREIFLSSKQRNKRPHRLQEEQRNVFSCVQVFFSPMVLLGKPFAGMRGGLW